MERWIEGNQPYLIALRNSDRYPELMQQVQSALKE